MRALNNSFSELKPTETGATLKIQWSTKCASLLLMMAFPNRNVIGSMRPQIKDVRGLMTLTGNPPRHGGRELRINEKVHVG